MPTLAYVGSYDITVIDTSTNKIINTFAAEPYPSGMAVTPNGNFLFMTNDVANLVSVVDTRNNRIIDIIPVGEFPEGIAITPNGRFAYVANAFSNTVSVINIITLTITATIPVGHSPEGVAISPNGNFAYVTNTLSNNVSVIDTSTNTVVTTIPVGVFPVSIKASTNNFIYVCNQGANAATRNISVIDFFTNRVVDTIPLDGAPTNLAIRPNSQYIYVTIGDLGIVDVVFTGSDRVVTSIEVGDLPWDVAITPDGRFAYVTNLGSDNVSVIDTSTNKVVDTIPVFQPLNIVIANIPPTPAPSDKICIETTRIFDSCMLEEQQEKTFNIPDSIETQDIQCKVIDAKSSILDITRINEQQDTVNVKLRLKVILGFTRTCSSDPLFKETVYFDKNVTLTSPEGADISCDINNATCECIQMCDMSCTHRISCTVKVNATIRSKKLVQIQVPFLGNCESEQSCPCEGIPVAPGKSLPLPNTPSEVSIIKFAARAAPGIASRLITFLNSTPYNFVTVTGELKEFEINLSGGPYPVGNISIRNFGNSTIYVCNLTTE